MQTTIPRVGLLTIALTLSVMLAGFARPAEARLARTRLANLIDESTLIVEAAPIKLERTGVLAGSARLKILRVIEGTLGAGAIEVKWGDEVHDQPIADLACDYVLFLRKTDSGDVVATHYGRSYWPLTSRVTDLSRADLDSKGRVFKYQHPLTVVTLSSKEQRRLTRREDGQIVIGAKELVEYIHERKQHRTHKRTH